LHLATSIKVGEPGRPQGQATRLYERAGMRVEHRLDFWVKRLG
jgi:hypothetical protein